MVIGLDGATLDLIEPWVAQGLLPNIARFIKDGTSGRLRSTVLPLTPTAWTSFRTGKNPGKHGIFDFEKREPNSYERSIVNSATVSDKAIWRILSELGRKVVVINVPMTYPVEEVNGIMISGVLAPPGATYMHPPGFEATLNKEIGGYKLGITEFFGGNLDVFLNDMHHVTHQRTKAILHIMKNFEWSFFMVVFNCTDQMAHNFWRYMDPNHPGYEKAKAAKYGDVIQRFYKEVDSIIGTIQNQLDQDTATLIMSDHGLGPLYKSFHVNWWLQDLGLLNLRRSSAKNLRNPEYWLSKIGVSREKIFGLILNLHLPKLYRFFEQTARKVEIGLDDIDWSRTKAYAYGHFGQIYINLKGRDPCGIVESGKEYENLRDLLIKELSKLKDPANNPVVDKCYRKEEVYHGPHLDMAPDILFLVNRGYCAYNGLEVSRNSIFGDPWGIQSGTHEMDGVLMMMGADIKKGVKIYGAQITDLVPTILHVMGESVPADMDGRVLKEIFEPQSPPAKEEIRYVDVNEPEPTKEFTLSKEEEEIVRERLRDLGYLSHESRGSASRKKE